MPGRYTNYDEFIQLSDNEKLFLIDIKADCPHDQQTNPPDNIINELKTIPYKSLLRLAENSPLIKRWCELPAMQPFWGNLWANTAGRKPTLREAKNNSQLSYRPLLPQSTVSAFNLMRGTWLYDHANYIAHEYGQTDSRIPPLLEKAVESHCFEAIRAINRINMTKLCEADSTVTFEDVFKKLSDEIKFHGTPVLLLLALSCFEAANLYAKENVITADHYCTLALMYVILAERVTELSINAIHNAYYGLGLQESNNYGWGTFAEWRSGILELIDADYHCVFESRAKQWADNFIAQQINMDESELVLSGYHTGQATTISTLTLSF